MSVDISLNNKILKLIQISSQESILLKSMENFYQSFNNYEFINIIKSNSKISIRLIDYFVTKYSKKNKINYKIDNNIFNVYQSYKQQLKAYQKKHFDPFARGIRIPYFINNECIITTIGQLIFFKWFISKKILDFVILNKDIIEIDMNRNKKNKFDNKIKKPNKIYNKKNDNKINNNFISFNNKIKNSIMVSFN